jgi:hypothetical protein
MNLSNITNDESQVYFLKKIAWYIEFAINIFGFFSNLFSMIIFYLICKKFTTNGQMYKYFLMKSICDFIFFIIYPVNQLYNMFCIDSCSYSFQIFKKYFFSYFISVIEAYSIYFEILATVDCYLSIKNKHKSLLTKRAFFISSSINFVIFPIIHCGKIFVFSILPSGNYYVIFKTSLYFSNFYKLFSILIIFLRDFLGFFLMFLFNVLIFLNLKSVAKKKKTMRNSQAHIRSIEATEKKAKMIYVCCLNNFIFHLPSIVYNVYGKYYINDFWTIFSAFKSVLFVFSYATPFIIYIIFNKIFQECFLKLACVNRNH